ncbi:hypothetical protein ACWD6Z_33280, partial [Streptomyces californicus]
DLLMDVAREHPELPLMVTAGTVEEGRGRPRARSGTVGDARCWTRRRGPAGGAAYGAQGPSMSFIVSVSAIWSSGP